MKLILFLLLCSYYISTSYCEYGSQLVQGADKRVIIHFHHYNITMNTSKEHDSIPAFSNITSTITTLSPNVSVQPTSIHSEYRSLPTVNVDNSQSSLSPLSPDIITSSSQPNSTNTNSPSVQPTNSFNHDQSTNNKDGLRIAVQSEGPYSLPNFGAYKHNQYDYENIHYGIPFNEYYQNMEKRYVDFGQSSFFPNYVLTGHIPPYRPGYDKRVIITGCSRNHFRSVFANFLSVLNASATINLVFIDFGLTMDELKSLHSSFAYLHKIHLAMNSSSFIAYRKFNFQTAPSWMDINSSNEHGGYAWKIISFLDVLDEWKSLTGWMDAGNIVYDGLDTEFDYAIAEGIYTPTRANPGDIAGRWTHPQMLEFFYQYKLITHINKNSPNCAAGHIFIDYHNQTVRDAILTPWRHCVYTKRCVLPNESSRKSHRWEQAALTTLLHNLNLTYANNPKYQHFPLIRQESMGYSKLNKLISQLKEQICRRNDITIRNEYCW